MTATILFILSGLTDLLDGTIARYLDQETVLGSYLDPIADKLLVLSIYFTLSTLPNKFFIIPKWFIIISLIKETILIIGSLYLYFRTGYLKKIYPTKIAKLLMGIQGVFIVTLLIILGFEIKTNIVKIIIENMVTVITILNIIVLFQYYLQTKHFKKANY